MLVFQSASTLQIDYVVAAWWIYQSYFHLKVDIELSFESQFSRAALLGDETQRNRLDTFIIKNAWRFLTDLNFYDVLTSSHVDNLHVCINSMHLLFSTLPVVIQTKCNTIHYNNAHDFRQTTLKVIQSIDLENTIQRSHMIFNICCTNRQHASLTQNEAFVVACLAPETMFTPLFTRQDLEFVLEQNFPPVPWEYKFEGGAHRLKESTAVHTLWIIAMEQQERKQ